MTIEELQLEYDRLFDNYTQRHSETITLKVEKEKLEKEIENLKNEIDGLDYDVRMLNVKYDELNLEYEDSEYDRDNLYWDYWELKEKCDKAYQIANQYLMNQASLEEVLDGIMLLNSDN
ncbi:hypothetical protein ACNNMY_02740 [Aerococcus urinaeequi]|uniref:hypothetical protein n=1 Tax=Aerococcus TaxID=1375 RepID=UPI003AAE5DB0